MCLIRDGIKMKTNKNIFIWGCGNLTKKYIKQIPEEMEIKGIIDIDNNKWGVTDICHNGKKLICGGDELKEDDFVIVAIENPHVVREISQSLDNRKIEWCHIFKVVDEAFLESGKYIPDIKQSGPMVKFIDVMVPIAKCNMKCEYCYLSHLKVELDKVSDFYHDARYIRYALSQERLGGSAFINLCGVGETLLCDNILEIVRELLKEGHYIQIVTNATPTGVIKSFINSDIDSSRLFMKCSLHYEELKKMHMLDRFAQNIKMLDEWGSSYTIEYVPMDTSVNLIPEIKEYCIKNFGALPHVTVTRDERYTDFRPLTDYSLDEYRKIWSQFGSEMFDFKLKYVIDTKKFFCMAGLWSAELNLATGELFKCTKNPRLCNIYQDIDEEIVFEEVGDKCCIPYCFNCHAYLTLGLMPKYDTPTYAAMRDRVKPDGTHWVKENLRDVFSQKLSDNNKN